MDGIDVVEKTAPDIVTTGWLLKMSPPCGDCKGVLTQPRMMFGDIGGAKDFVAYRTCEVCCDVAIELTGICCAFIGLAKVREVVVVADDEGTAVAYYNKNPNRD